ncbi:hypothetical protein J6590_065134 [Homalodisca vitripennis]|nr:hypothetical protein J6590_065134 [Homalodisca vitripennis]
MSRNRCAGMKASEERKDHHSLYQQPKRPYRAMWTLGKSPMRGKLALVRGTTPHCGPRGSTRWDSREVFNMKVVHKKVYHIFLREYTRSECLYLPPTVRGQAGQRREKDIEQGFLCEDLIKQNKGESQCSTRLIVLIKSATVADRI